MKGRKVKGRIITVKPFLQTGLQIIDYRSNYLKVFIFLSFLNILIKIKRSAVHSLWWILAIWNVLGIGQIVPYIRISLYPRVHNTVQATKEISMLFILSGLFLTSSERLLHTNSM